MWWLPLVLIHLIAGSSSILSSCCSRRRIRRRRKEKGGGVKSVSLVKASLPSQFALKHTSAWLFALRLVWFWLSFSSILASSLLSFLDLLLLLLPIFDSFFFS